MKKVSLPAENENNPQDPASSTSPWMLRLGRLERNWFEGVRFCQAILFSSIRFLIWFYVLTGQREKADSLVPAFATRWSRGIFRQRKCTVVVEGSEHLPRDRAFVAMVNHQSRYDILLLLGYLERPVGFVAKKELFQIPVVSFWLRQFHSIPIDRKDTKGGAAALKEHGRKLKEEGRGIIIFPEGTRTRHPDREIQEFRQGSLRMASDHNIPVVPISLDGTRFLERIEYYRRTPASSRVLRIKIAPPVNPEAKNGLERRQLMESLRETIVSNWKAIRVEWPTS